MELKITMKYNEVVIRDENLCLYCGSCGGGLLFIKAKKQKVTMCENCNYNKVEDV